ncbi:MAG TPA: hypothetical protein VFO84_05000 [Dehalococcoidia bacterium]|nr:hypothetical protein [Dehalococcoidia bacterium]
MAHTWTRSCPGCGGDLTLPSVSGRSLIECSTCGAAYTIRQISQLNGRLARIMRDVIAEGLDRREEAASAVAS